MFGTASCWQDGLAVGSGRSSHGVQDWKRMRKQVSAARRVPSQYGVCKVGDSATAPQRRCVHRAWACMAPLWLPPYLCANSMDRVRVVAESLHIGECSSTMQACRSFSRLQVGTSSRVEEDEDATGWQSKSCSSELALGDVGMSSGRRFESRERHWRRHGRRRVQE